MRTTKRRRRKGAVHRAAGFIIRKLSGKHRAQPFLVDVRRTGLVRRKTFAVLKAAEAYCAELREELDGNGLSAFDLSDAQRMDAKNALELLGGRCALDAAARFWLKYHPDQGAVTYAETLTRYRLHMEAQRVRPATMQGLWRLERVGRELGKMALVAITSDDLTRWLADRGFTATNRNNYRRRLSALFAFAVEQGIIERNPVERVPVVKMESAPVVFWTAEQVASLLHTTETLYPDLVPLFSIIALAGLRPAEAEALRWESINLTERIVRVEGATSKTRARRAVPMSENLVAWLTKYRRKSGPVAPKAQTLRRWRERIAAAVVLGDVPERMAKRKGMMGTAIKAAGNLSWEAMLTEAKKTRPVLWPPDVLRHSYASHWLPVHKDEGALALAMGNSPNVIHRHYRGLVTEAEAGRYWEIMPATAGLVISISAAAG